MSYVKMNSQELTLRNRISHFYSDIFENKLIDEMVKVGHFDTIKKGDLLIDIGDDMTHIPLILNGVIKIIRKENDKELVLYYLERGDTCAISFANCINKKQSIFKGIVEEDVDLVLLPVEKIDKWLVKYKSWRYFIIDSYHNRLLEMVGSIDSLAFLKMKARVLNYLIGKLHATTITRADRSIRRRSRRVASTTVSRDTASSASISRRSVATVISPHSSRIPKCGVSKALSGGWTIRTWDSATSANRATRTKHRIRERSQIRNASRATHPQDGTTPHGSSTAKRALS